MLLKIYTDGASRGNPGKSASGYIILDADGAELLRKSFYNGIKTNNEAEYLAVIGALEQAAEAYGYGSEISLYSDSSLIVNQLAGRFRIRSREMAGLNKEAMSLLAKFASYSLHNVPREDRFITEVDGDLNLLLDKY